MKNRMFVMYFLVMIIVACTWIVYSSDSLAALALRKENPETMGTIGMPIGSRSWGALRNGSSQFLYFEAADGTIRMFDTTTAKVITIMRQ